MWVVAAATIALIGALVAIAILGRRRDLHTMGPPKMTARNGSNGHGNGNGTAGKPRPRLTGGGIDVPPKSKARHR